MEGTFESLKTHIGNPSRCRHAPCLCIDVEDWGTPNLFRKFPVGSWSLSAQELCWWWLGGFFMRPCKRQHVQCSRRRILQSLPPPLSRGPEGILLMFWETIGKKGVDLQNFTKYSWAQTQGSPLPSLECLFQRKDFWSVDSWGGENGASVGRLDRYLVSGGGGVNSTFYFLVFKLGAFRRSCRKH